MASKFDKPQDSGPSLDDKLKQWAKNNPEEYARLMQEADAAASVGEQDALHPENRAETGQDIALGIIRNDALLYWIPLVKAKNILNVHGRHLQAVNQMIQQYSKYGIDLEQGEQIMESAQQEVEQWFLTNQHLPELKLERAIEKWMDEISRDNDRLLTKLDNYDQAA